MSNVLTSSRLINSIKRRGMIPSDQRTFDDADFLDMLNEEIQYFGVPHLMRTHEEYLVYSVDVSLVSGQSSYAIPERALGNKLREVSYVTNVSGITGSNTGEQIYELSRIKIDDLPDYNNYASSTYTNAFYIKNDKIVLLGEIPQDNSVLRMYFYLRPNTLVDEDRVGVIESIDTVGGVITVTTFPDNFSSIPQMDFVKSKTPNTILSYDAQPTAVNSVTRTITFDADDLPSDLAVGDYLCNAQETPVPQLPVELHAVLAQRVTVAALEALGDQEGLVTAQRRLEMMEKSTNDLIDNRVEGALEKITNRHGPLRAASLRSRFKRGLK